MKFSTALFTFATLGCVAASGFTAGFTADLAKAHGHHDPPAGVWVPAKSTDSRSPCPVMNSLANHGHLPRDGRGLTPEIINSTLQNVLNIEPLLTNSMATGILAIADKKGRIQLSDLALHNFLEHDASYTRNDVKPGELFAPLKLNQTKIAKVLTYANSKKQFTWREFANARVAIETEVNSAPNVTVVAGVEISLILQTFGKGVGRDYTIAASAIGTLFGKERFPDGFVKPRIQTTNATFLPFATFITEQINVLKASTTHIGF